MILQLKIKVDSHLLGDKKEEDGIKRFKRLNNRIDLDSFKFKEKIIEALSDLNFICAENTILFESNFISPTLHLYKRTYSKLKVEYYEIIRKGTVLTFNIIIKEGKDMCPNTDLLRQAIENVGKFYGISPWGSKFGYGRFSVISMTK